MRIAIGSDHGGFDLKEELLQYVQELGYDVLDVGTAGPESVDYPDFAEKVGKAIQDGSVERGILLCGSGVGVCISANKIQGVYAAVCHDAYSAQQGVEHDQMNVLCLGGRVVGAELAKLLVRTFLEANYQGRDPGGERFQRRVEKIKALERKESTHE